MFPPPSVPREEFQFIPLPPEPWIRLLLIVGKLTMSAVSVDEICDAFCWARLSEKMQLVRVASLGLLRKPPPSHWVEFLLKVQLIRVGLPVPISIPPPPHWEKFRMKVQLISVGLLLRHFTAPPPSWAEFPLKVIFFKVGLPFSM